MDNPIRFSLKPEDDADAPAASPMVEIVRAPRRLRGQLVKLDGQILELQDLAEDLFGYVRDPNARRLLGRLYGGLEESHQLLQRTADAVERG